MRKISGLSSYSSNLAMTRDSIPIPQLYRGHQHTNHVYHKIRGLQYRNSGWYSFFTLHVFVRCTWSGIVMVVLIIQIAICIMTFKYIITYKKSLLIFSVSFLSTCIVALLGLKFLFTSPIHPSKTQSQTEVLAQTQEKPDFLNPPENTKTLGILLLGYGGPGHAGGYLTDAIQILYFDFDKAKVALISLPRDLGVKLADGRQMKINAALINSSEKQEKADWMNGAAVNMKQLISDIVGVSVHYFVAVDFVGFQRTVGLSLKGIEIEVGETLDDPWYPISGEELNPCGLTPKEVADLTHKFSGFELEKKFPCRYEHLHFEKGTVHMEAGEALKYIRSRHGSTDGDISRGRRQQEVLLAIKKKLLLLNAFDDIPVFFEEAVKHVQTDINLEIANYLVPLIKNIRDAKISIVNLSTANVLSFSNQSTLIYPKEGLYVWSEVRSYIKEQIYGP